MAFHCAIDLGRRSKEDLDISLLVRVVKINYGNNVYELLLTQICGPLGKTYLT
jgi:hypothetical protein